MAVFTQVDADELAVFVEAYGVGPVRSCTGIAEGYENSNYRLVTASATLILTLYEKRVRIEHLPFFLGLMDHLADRGVPCPRPLKARDGRSWRALAGRPAALLTFLEGDWPRAVTVDHCARMGRAVAELHRAGDGFQGTRANDLALADWRRLFERNASQADAVAGGLAATVAEELAFLEGRWPHDLPTGIVHADLFPDNVFFRDGAISGIIDFYFACRDFLAYDLAVCLNAWCFDAGGNFEPAKAAALVNGYQTVRALNPAERNAMAVLARGAALRFLLTRLHDWLHPAPGLVAKRKDPLEFLNRLRFHQGADGAEAYGLE